jgi:hypothetical protein
MMDTLSGLSVFCMNAAAGSGRSTRLFWGELEGGMNAKKLVSFNLALKIFENQ